MPWNDEANGPGNKSNTTQGPWGQGPRKGPGGGNGGGGGGGQQPPDLEDLIRSMQKGLGGFGARGGGRGGRGGGKGGPAILVLAGAALLAIWVISSSFYVVGPAEQGVVLRFGQFDRTTNSGLHFKLPTPFERVETIDVVDLKTLTIGATGDRRGDRTDSLMLTGDENIVDLTFTIQWRIDEANTFDFLFNVDDPEQALRAVSESVMREVIGQSNVRPIISNEIGGIAQRVREKIQETLNEYEVGIIVTEVAIDRPTLPEAENPQFRGDVTLDPLAAFRDVENAEQEKQKAIQDARAYANRVVPEARGQAQRTIEEANGYRDSVIAEATGEAERFRQIYEQYRLAPEVTRQRMYLETMEGVLANSDKVLLDNDGGAGAVPYLPLNEINRARAN